MIVDVMGGLHITLSTSIIWLSMNALLITAQGATKVCTENSRIHQQGVCGRAIPRLLSALCGKGGYNNKQYKRSEAPPLDTLDSSLADMDAKTFLMLSEVSPGLASRIAGFVQSKQEASTFLNKRSSYYRTGIACECCYHKCTVRELAMYCKNGARGLQSRISF